MLTVIPQELRAAYSNGEVMMDRMYRNFNCVGIGMEYLFLRGILIPRSSSWVCYSQKIAWKEEDNLE